LSQLIGNSFAGDPMGPSPDEIHVIASEAKQSRLDCRAASRLAMTIQTKTTPL
jgi:hypothetical protein